VLINPRKAVQRRPLKVEEKASEQGDLQATPPIPAR